MKRYQRRIRKWLKQGIRHAVLDLSDLDLTELPRIPEGVEVLKCSNNKITKLSNLPLTLKKLICVGNFITHLSNIPEGVETVICGVNDNLISIDDLPDSVKTLELREIDSLLYINKLPLNLKTLDLSYINHLAKISFFPPNLRVLCIEEMNIKILPPFPESLRKICLVQTNVHTILLPPYLKVLHLCCSGVRSIGPVLPESLLILYFDNVKVIKQDDNSINIITPNNDHLKLPNSLYEFDYGYCKELNFSKYPNNKKQT